jgi:hypothetical protein
LAELAVAKSILDEAGIPFFSKGEMPMELLAVGPVEIQVDKEDAFQAAELLKDLAEDRPAGNLIEPPPGDNDD